MTPDFDLNNNNHQPSPMNHHNPGSGSLETIQRDRFELLSAYLDGEVTAAERKQVEEWLASDPTVQRLHSRLLKLRQGFQSLPVPVSDRSVEDTVEAVFARVERKPRLSLIWGGAAIAALFVGALATLLPGQDFSPQIAESPKPQTQAAQPNANKDSEPLLIALDKPLVAIPKAPVSAPVSPVKNAGGVANSTNQLH